MSTDGPGIFDDDLAWDVREGYRRLLQDRVPDDEATRRTIDAWVDLGPDEQPVLWLALSAAQTRLGRLDPEVRDRALAVLHSGEDLARWERHGPELAAARAAALAELRAQLTGPQPPRRAIRRPYRYVTDLQPGTVLAWRASTGVVVPLRVVQIRGEDDMGVPILEQLAWDGPDVPSEDVLAGLPRAAAVAPLEDGQLREPVYGLFKLKRRDPDWADVGFTVCGSVPSRPGDDGDFSLGTSFTLWEGLPIQLEHAVTGRWPDGPVTPAGP